MAPTTAHHMITIIVMMCAASATIQVSSASNLILSTCEMRLAHVRRRCEQLALGVCKGKAWSWFIPPRVRPGESHFSQYGTSSPPSPSPSPPSPIRYLALSHPLRYTVVHAHADPGRTRNERRLRPLVLDGHLRQRLRESCGRVRRWRRGDDPEKIP